MANYRCTLCGYTKSQKRDVVRHVIEAHNIDERDAEKYVERVESRRKEHQQVQTGGAPDQRIAQLEQQVLELRIGLDMLRSKVENELTSIKSSIDQVFERLKGLDVQGAPSEGAPEETKEPPIEVGRIEVPDVEVPRKVTLSTKTLMYYVYTRALALKKTGKDIDLSSFINGTIEQFFEKCVGISFAVIKREVGEELPNPRELEVEVGSEHVSESGSEGETHGEG